ncbi:aldehyde dehydrogenase family protein [Fusibacter bizertensis]
MFYKELYINGEWVKSNLDEIIEIENPATRDIIGSVPKGNEVDVELAVKSAALAFDQWKGTPMESRILYMEIALNYLKAKKELLVNMEVAELGAPLKWAERAHVVGPIIRFENYIKLVKNYKFSKKLTHATIVKEPVGVVGCITPWNYPLGQIMQKVIPAILTGNTVVLKPSQIAPLSAMVLAEAFHYAKLPKGVFNLVTGRAGEVGNALAKHKLVNMISFTGSTAGGREVAKLALDSIKKVALELGGKSPLIILEGADLELAVKAGLSSCYDNTGQTCAALTRMIVPKKYLGQIETLIIDNSRNYIVGNPNDANTHIGPLASLKQYSKVRSYIQLGLDEGAKLIVGELPKSENELGNEGYYVKPTVFTNVNNQMRIAREEIFGPVICLITYETIDEAIEIANDTDYGLSGAVFGPDILANKVALAIRTGSIAVNDGKRDIDAPFGGYKQSGIGREGGLQGIEEFLEIKSIFNEVNPIINI